MDHCRDFIRTIPVLQTDPHNLDDINTKGEDHIADETRYFLNSRRKDRLFEEKGQQTPEMKRYSEGNFDYRRIMGYGN